MGRKPKRVYVRPGDWAHQAEILRQEAAALPDGPEKKKLLSKADQISAAYQLKQAMAPTVKS